MPDTPSPAVSGHTAGQGAVTLVARCENVDETTEARCTGRLRFTWGMPEAACDACGARCGIAVAEWLRVEPAASPAVDELAEAEQYLRGVAGRTGWWTASGITADAAARVLAEYDRRAADRQAFMRVIEATSGHISAIHEALGMSQEAETDSVVAAIRGLRERAEEGDQVAADARKVLRETERRGAEIAALRTERDAALARVAQMEGARHGVDVGEPGAR